MVTSFHNLVIHVVKQSRSLCPVSRVRLTDQEDTTISDADSLIGSNAVTRRSLYIIDSALALPKAHYKIADFSNVRF